MKTVNVIMSAAAFILDRALFLTQFAGREAFYYLRGTGREEREHN